MVMTLASLGIRRFCMLLSLTREVFHSLARTVSLLLALLIIRRVVLNSPRRFSHHRLQRPPFQATLPFSEYVSTWSVLVVLVLLSPTIWSSTLMSLLIISSILWCRVISSVRIFLI